MSQAKTNVLVTGATGYIGGSVLNRFLHRPDVDSFNISAIVRSPEKAEKLKRLGVNAVVGSLSDLTLVEQLASKADVLFSTADADDFKAVRSFLNGLEKRHKETGTIPILIHTSGTGVLTDRADGMYVYDTIYNDADPDQIETLALTQVHRNVDLEIVNADKQGYVKAHIILPSTIYGIATGRLVDLGIQNPYSLQVPAIISASLARGQGGMVGLGKNVWPHVHIDDIADLYLVLFNSILSNPHTGHGREGFYFGENGEYRQYDLSKAVATELVSLGRGKSEEPTTFTDEEIDKYFGGSKYMGTNSRCRADRSRSIGWKPAKTSDDFFASIKPEIEALIKAKNL